MACAIRLGREPDELEQCPGIGIHMADIYPQAMKPSFRTSLPAGFTLIELMVAMAVMGLILFLMLQISTQSQQATRTSRNKIESEKRSRAVLDTLAADFANRVIGPNTPVFVKQSNGDLQVAFLTRSRGPAGMSDFRFLAVAYELSDSRILRKTAAVEWDQADLLPSVVNAVSSATSSIVANGVLRFEATVILSDGTRTPLNTATSVSWMSETWQGGALPTGFEALLVPKSDASVLRAHALVIGVAAIDDSNFDKLSSAGVNGLELLPNATGADSPADVWSEILSTNIPDGIPSEALSSLSLLQQTFPLH